MDKPRKPITKKYLSSWEALYGDNNRGNPSTKGYTISKPKDATIKPEVESEAMAQARLVRKARSMGLPLFSIPNGGRRTRWQGQLDVSTGLTAGMPDLMLPIARGNYHGLFIEMKREKKSVLTLVQRECLAMLNHFGYMAIVAYGFDEAWKILDDYLSVRFSDETLDKIKLGAKYLRDPKWK